MVQTLLVPVGFGNSGLQKCNGAWFLKLLHATMYFIIISSKIISETNAVDFFLYESSPKLLVMKCFL